MSGPARIIVIDDHPVFRRGLADILATEVGLTLCGQFDSPYRGFLGIQRLKPDLAISELFLPGDGFDLFKSARRASPRTKILVLTRYDEMKFAPRALRSGAHGYLMKQAPAVRILKAVREVLAGEISASDALKRKLLLGMTGGPASGSLVDRLTDREVEVLRLLGAGCGTRTIAEKLHRSVKTVENHRANIRRKLLLTDSGELIRFASDWLGELGQ